MDLFDKWSSERAKTVGKTIAAEAQPTNLELAQDIAREMGLLGEVNADDVGRVLLQRHSIKSLGGAAGSIFSGDDWKWTGKFVKSTRTKNHSRLLMVWRLKSFSSSASDEDQEWALSQVSEDP